MHKCYCYLLKLNIFYQRSFLNCPHNPQRLVCEHLHDADLPVKGGFWRTEKSCIMPLFHNLVDEIELRYSETPTAKNSAPSSLSSGTSQTERLRVWSFLSRTETGALPTPTQISWPPGTPS